MISIPVEREICVLFPVEKLKTRVLSTSTEKALSSLSRGKSEENLTMRSARFRKHSLPN